MADFEANEENNTKLYTFLHLSIKPSIRDVMGDVEEGNGMQLWERLCEYYEKDDVVAQQALLRELLNLRMKSGEHIKQYIARIIKCLSKLRQRETK